MYGVATASFNTATESKQMTHKKKYQSHRIARRAGKQGARPATLAQIAVEKLATEPKEKIFRLMKGKRNITISTFNTRTLQNTSKIPELINSAISTNQDIICIQEHRFLHEDTEVKEHNIYDWKMVTTSAWKNNVNATNGGCGMLLSPLASKALINTEKISPRIMIANFKGNPQTTVISCYSPTNVHDEIEVEDFYNELAAVVRQLPKHTFIVIGGDFNAQLGKSDDNRYTSHTTTNRNGTMLQNFLTENKLICLNTKFQKRHNQLYSFTSANNSRSQIDFVLISKKWKNSAINCRAYSSFLSVQSDHRIVTANLRLSLRANICRSKSTPSPEWSSLKNDVDIRNNFVIELKNRFALLENENHTNSPNESYKNFEQSCKEAASLTIPTKPKIQKQKPWESKEVCSAREELHRAATTRDFLQTPESESTF